MTQNKIEIHFTDKDHVWINGRQYISLGRVGQMLSEKHKTNADRIRSMSDEELAEWVWSAESSGRAYGVRGKNAWLKWLKAPAEEVEE